MNEYTMTKVRRREIRDAEGTVVVGAPPPSIRDLYHHFLMLPSAAAAGLLVVALLLVNLVFASIYYCVGGIANTRPDSFVDCFYFSVHTLGTIGYGSMYPTSDLAHAVVVVESLTGILAVALITGLTFARFTQFRPRVAFANWATIFPMNGVPTLMLRTGNQRGNLVFEARVLVTLVRTERTTEGVLFYRMYDLPLVRDRSPAFRRSWNVMHTIDATSPLSGVTPESLQVDEVELIVSITGTDGTSLQPLHAQHLYTTNRILFGHRPADMLSENGNGQLLVDMERFDEVVPTLPTEGFPYPVR